MSLFAFFSIEQYHAALTRGHTTCVAAVEHYLRQIRSHSRLNAFIEVYEQEALHKAALLDERRNAGHPMRRMHGVVIGIKDVICHKDHKVAAASKILGDFTSLYSATAVDRLLEEEAIIIGSCNCDEFAMGSTNEHSARGKVLNARDEARVPGGSSGGSAVAVQAGLCMISLGSDTGGSVRQPADFCGVIGLKPTYGRISRYGLIAYASSFDQIGVFAKTIPDVALALELMAGSDDFDSTVSSRPVEAYSSLLSTDKKFRIAYLEQALSHPALDPEISSSIRQWLRELERSGHQVAPVHFDLLDYVVPAYYVLTTAEASSNLSRYDGVKYGWRAKFSGQDINELYKETRTKGFGREVRRRIMLGTFVLSAGYYDAYFTRAQKVRKRVKDDISLIFNDYDLIILPTSPSTAFRIGEKTDDPISMYLADIYTVMANLAGIPAISLPLFEHSNGMPFGVQAMSNHFNELALLRFSNLVTRG